MNERILSVMIGGSMCDVHVAYRNNRNMYLRIRPDGTLCVSCGRRVSDEQIIRFLHEKEAWILQHRLEAARSAQMNREGTSGSSIWWLGDEKQVRYLLGRRNFCWVDGDTVTFELKDQNEEAIIKAFRLCASRTLSILIDEKRTQWDEDICLNHHLPLPNISIRYMTSRWGVCSPGKAHITMSTRLIHYPEVCLDYVLLHEYVHFLVPNHSAAFYNEVKKRMPAYADYEKLLK